MLSPEKFVLWKKGTAAVGRLWFATRSLPQRRRTADLQWDRAGGGAGNGSGCISAGPVRSFCGKVFTKWAGHSIAQSVWARAYYQQQRGRAATITQQYERWLSNGFVSCFVAGKIGSPMRRINTWRHSLSEARHWVSSR